MISGRSKKAQFSREVVLAAVGVTAVALLVLFGFLGITQAGAQSRNQLRYHYLRGAFARLRQDRRLGEAAAHRWGAECRAGASPAGPSSTRR